MSGQSFKIVIPAEILSRIRSGHPLRATPIGAYSFEDLDRVRRVRRNERARAFSASDRERVARWRAEHGDEYDL